VTEVADLDYLVLSVVGGDPAVVRAEGELDVAGVCPLLLVLAERDGDVELDCSGLSFIDAAGVGAIVRAHQACEARGAKLVLVDPSDPVVRVLRLVKLDTFFHIR
jgi:anti-sigma B factor antagonist